MLEKEKYIKIYKLILYLKNPEYIYNLIVIFNNFLFSEPKDNKFQNKFFNEYFINIYKIFLPLIKFNKDDNLKILLFEEVLPIFNNLIKFCYITAIQIKAYE